MSGRAPAAGTPGPAGWVQDEPQQRGPVREPEHLREHAQLVEEAAAGAGLAPALLPQVGDAIQDLVQREGEQVQRREQVRQTVLAVPEVVLEVVAVARQAIEGLILDLPPGAARTGDRGHVVGVDLEAGEERIVVGALAVALDLEVDPGALQGVGAGAHGHVLAPLVAMELDLPVAVAGADPVGGVDAAVGELLV